VELLSDDYDRSELGRILRDEQRYAIGLDLGKSGDPAALAIVEEVVRTYEGRDRLSGERRETRELNCRHLQRWPLGTAYFSVADDVCKLERRPPLSSQARLLVDATGVGRPVIEILRKRGLLCPLSAVTLHGGACVTGGDAEIGLPKRDLVASLIVAIEDGSLHIAPALPEAAQLRKELVGFRQKVTGKGNASYEAMSEAVHDDLVNALGLAVWFLRPLEPCGHQGGPLFTGV
jgi:hypothetical protein